VWCCGNWVLGENEERMVSETLTGLRASLTQPPQSPTLQTSAVRIRRNCLAVGKTGRPMCCHSWSGLQSWLSR
jgi:hypothetical protein